MAYMHYFLDGASVSSVNGYVAHNSGETISYTLDLTDLLALESFSGIRLYLTTVDETKSITSIGANYQMSNVSFE